jgi:iron complex transport system substrate-binding protein
MNRLVGGAWYSPFLPVSFLLLLALSCADGEGGDASVPAREPERVVSLAPNLTEILFALGLGDRVVGVTDYCNYPAAAREKPRVGGFLNPNLEAIARLRPTLLVGLPGHRRATPGLAAFDAEFLEVRNTSVDEVLDSILQIGRRLGRPAAAESLAAVIRGALREGPPPGTRPPRVLLVSGRNPGELRNVYAPGRGSFYDELLEAAGADNVVRTSEPLYPMLSLEEIVRADPQIIIELRPGTSYSTRELETIRSDWDELDRVSAVRRGHVEIWTEDYLAIPGPRMIRLLAKLRDTVRRFPAGEREPPSAAGE